MTAPESGIRVPLTKQNQNQVSPPTPPRFKMGISQVIVIIMQHRLTRVVSGQGKDIINPEMHNLRAY